MNIVKIGFIDAIINAIINFVASLACPTFGCTQDDMDKMKVVKGKLPAPVCTYRPDMPDDIILDEDPRA